MVIPTHITALFTDSNEDSIKVKLETKPFISGFINSVINWMVSNPIGNVDMEDIKSHETFFFLACKYNPNNELIIWLVETGETQLYFVNSKDENVFEYLAKSAFNSPQISSRLILLIKLGFNKNNFDKNNKFGDSLFDILCYSGYIDVIKYIFSLGYKPSQEKMNQITKKINKIITGECDEYWSSDEIDEELLIGSLEKILNLFQI